MRSGRSKAFLATLLGTSASTIIVSVQTVVLVPLYLVALGPRLYGAWLASGEILVWMQVFDLGLPNLITQRIGVAHGVGDEKRVMEYFASGLLVIAVVGLALAAGALAVSPLLANVLGVTGHEAVTLHRCFAVSACAASLNLLSNCVVGVSRGIQETTFLNAASVIGGILGFCVSLYLVITGAGLWAIAFGLVTRHAVVFASCLAFAWVLLRRSGPGYLRPRLFMLREFARLTPLTALGGLGYSAINQGETTMVAVLFRPELATVYALTRKLLEVGRSAMDAIAFASYGAFAHLVASGERRRTLHVHAELSALRLSLALVAGSAYVAVNGALLSVWVGRQQYGGPLLTIVMAVQFVAVGGSFLTNYLYRAMGPVGRGSAALVVEGVMRLLGVLAFVRWFGVVGVPLAGIVSATTFIVLGHRWTVREASSYAEPYPATPVSVWLARIGVFALGVIFCVSGGYRSWSYVVAVAVVVTVAGTLTLLAVDPLLARTRASIISFGGRIWAK